MRNHFEHNKHLKKKIIKIESVLEDLEVKTFIDLINIKQLSLDTDMDIVGQMNESMHCDSTRAVLIRPAGRGRNDSLDRSVFKTLKNLVVNPLHERNAILTY